MVSATARDLRLGVHVEGSEKAARDIDHVADQIDDAGRKAKVTAGQFDHLADQISQADRAIAELSERFRSTGQINLVPSIKEAVVFRDELKGIKRELDRIDRQRVNVKLDVDDSVFRRLGGHLGKLGGSLSGVLGSVGRFGGIGLGIGTVAGPAVGAATLLGAGLGGLAPGIVGAAQDPKVQSAFSKLADTFKKSITGAGGPLVGPLTAVAGRWEQTVSGTLGPMFKRLSVALAPQLQHLGEGISGLVEKMAPGFERAAKSAAPLLDLLARHLPKIGDALSKFFDEVARNEPKIELFLDRLLHFTEWVIVATGKLIGFFSNVYLAVDAAISKILEFFGLLNPPDKTLKTRGGSAQGRAGSGGGRIGFGARAAGGPVSSGLPYWVGEKGPELFVPGMSGAIVPAGGFGGGTLRVQAPIVVQLSNMREIHRGLIEFAVDIGKTPAGLWPDRR